VTLIPGDGQCPLVRFHASDAHALSSGIGPEISQSIKDIYVAAQVSIAT